MGKRFSMVSINAIQWQDPKCAFLSLKNKEAVFNRLVKNTHLINGKCLQKCFTPSSVTEHPVSLLSIAYFFSRNPSHFLSSNYLEEEQITKRFNR